MRYTNSECVYHWHRWRLITATEWVQLPPLAWAHRAIGRGTETTYTAKRESVS